MIRYHVNKEGNAGVCEANKGKCPYGGLSGDEGHFNTIKEARQYYEKKQLAENNENKTFPNYAIFGNLGKVRILYYVGNGTFRVLTRNNREYLAHRGNLTFIKNNKKATSNDKTDNKTDTPDTKIEEELRLF